MSTDAVEKTLALHSLEESHNLFHWPLLQYCPWILKAGTIDASIHISLTLITF